MPDQENIEEVVTEVAEAAEEVAVEEVEDQKPKAKPRTKAKTKAKADDGEVCGITFPAHLVAAKLPMTNPVTGQQFGRTPVLVKEAPKEHSWLHSQILAGYIRAHS